MLRPAAESSVCKVNSLPATAASYLIHSFLLLFFFFLFFLLLSSPLNCRHLILRRRRLVAADILKSGAHSLTWLIIQPLPLRMSGDLPSEPKRLEPTLALALASNLAGVTLLVRNCLAPLLSAYTSLFLYTFSFLHFVLHLFICLAASASAQLFFV